MMMNIETFAKNFRKSTMVSIEHGSKYISNSISDNITYDIEYNMSYDESFNNDFDFYDEDEGLIKVNLSFEDVVDDLYRNGKVPAWIDISIIKSNKFNTRLNLICAGRYTNNLDQLYYVKQGTFPFGIKSPVLLPWIGDSGKYHIFYKRNVFGKFLNYIRWSFNIFIHKLK